MYKLLKHIVLVLSLLLCSCEEGGIAITTGQDVTFVMPEYLVEDASADGVADGSAYIEGRLTYNADIVTITSVSLSWRSDSPLSEGYTHAECALDGRNYSILLEGLPVGRCEFYLRANYYKVDSVTKEQVSDHYTLDVSSLQPRLVDVASEVEGSTATVTGRLKYDAEQVTLALVRALGYTAEESSEGVETTCVVEGDLCTFTFEELPAGEYTYCVTADYQVGKRVAMATLHTGSLPLSTSGDTTEPEPEPTPDPDTPQQPATLTATLTYDEAKGSIAGYKSPQTYTNSYGEWTICAYDYGSSAMQLNDGKVAYIKTPTFEQNITSIELTTLYYTDDLYICSAAGTTSASGIIKSFRGGGYTATADLSDTECRSVYIRSGACVRISSITVTCAGTSSEDNTPDTPDTPDNGGGSGSEGDGTGGSEGGNDGNEGGTDGGEVVTPPTTTSTLSWAELPVITDGDGDGVCDSDNTLYYARHLCAGGEKNAQRDAAARNYTVCFSARHHCPLWVAAPRHSMYEGSSGRNDSYRQDPDIPESVQYSSKSTGGGCNKGHMIGSAERTSSVATNKQVFYYSNIAPQYSSTFNTGGGAWNNLEDHIDGLVCKDTLYVVVGCYFEAFSRNGASASPSTISFGGRSDVSCPTMFYYALLRTKSGASGKRVQECSADELQCAAFTICHKMAKGHKPEAADMMSISELEQLTGVTYFPNVPSAPKSSFSPSDWL